MHDGDHRSHRQASTKPSSTHETSRCVQAKKKLLHCPHPIPSSSTRQQLHQDAYQAQRTPFCSPARLKQARTQGTHLYPNSTQHRCGTIWHQRTSKPEHKPLWVKGFWCAPTAPPVVPQCHTPHRTHIHSVCSHSSTHAATKLFKVVEMLLV